MMGAVTLKDWILLQGQCSSFDMRTASELSQVNNCPWPCALLLSLGALTFARFTFKTLVVFLQTFILSGTDVCASYRACFYI